MTQVLDATPLVFPLNASGSSSVSVALAPVYPLAPPADWFSKPGWLTPLQKLTIVTDGPEAGRVAGYVAPWDQCLLAGDNDCWTVPPSPTAYMAAMQGDTLTADGALIPTANIGGGVNHARVSANFTGAVAHYENTASQLMRVQYGEDEHGVWFAGVAWPEVMESPREIAMIRASAVSGDWRYRRELRAYDMTGVQLVNNPGQPLIRRLGPRAASLWVEDPLHALPPVYVGGLGGDPGEFDADDEPDVRIAALEARVADLQEALVDVMRHA